VTAPMQFNVGDADDLVVEWTCLAPGSNPHTHEVTPVRSDDARAHISFFNGANRSYWDGSAFVAGDPIELTMTISGKQATYSYTHQEATKGKEVLFEYWLDPNKAATYGRTERFVGTAPLKASQADVQFPSQVTDPEP
jgi:hypothetical protein